MVRRRVAGLHRDLILVSPELRVGLTPTQMLRLEEWARAF